MKHFILNLNWFKLNLLFKNVHIYIYMYVVLQISNIIACEKISAWLK